MTAFPRQPAQWHKVTVTNNMIDNNVAGWAGGGISLADTLNASLVDNTIASNDSVGIAGVVLAGGVQLPGASTGQAGVGRPSPSGIVTERTSAALLAQLGTPSLRATNAISQPELVDNIVWQNRSFYYSGDGRLCAGNVNTPAAVAGACTVLPPQSTTGQCPAGARYWDLGVLGDAGTTPGAVRLNPSFSVLTSAAGYPGPGNRTSDPRLADAYCNGSRVVPELGTVLNPPGVLNLQVSATVDEGNNYVNLRYGPLYTVNPTTQASFGDYHLSATTSSAYNTGTATHAPNHDFDAQPRPMGGAYDIGADEFSVPSPILVVNPTSLAFGGVSVNTSGSLTVTVANDPAATANLVLAAPTLTAGTSGSSQPARYSLTNGCPVGGSGLAPGAPPCTITVRFAPTALTLPTLQTATLNVAATGVATAHVALSGTGVVPAYSITPGPLLGHNFGTQAVGTQSAPFQFTLKNTGSIPVSGGEVWLSGNPSLSGVFASQFSAAFRSGSGDTCTAATHLAPGATCTFSVVFAPTSAGAKGTGVGSPGARVDVTHVAGAVNIGLFGSPVWGTGR